MYTDLLPMGKKEINKKEEDICTCTHHYLDCYSAGIVMLSHTSYQHFANNVLKLKDFEIYYAKRIEQPKPNT